MNWTRGGGAARTFAVSEWGDGWEVRRDAVPVGGRFHSRGDAIRAACFRAREDEKQGARARVIAHPGGIVMPHYEPHFGL